MSHGDTKNKSVIKTQGKKPSSAGVDQQIWTSQSKQKSSVKSTEAKDCGCPSLNGRIRAT